MNSKPYLIFIVKLLVLLENISTASSRLLHGKSHSIGKAILRCNPIVVGKDDTGTLTPRGYFCTASLRAANKKSITELVLVVFVYRDLVGSSGVCFPLLAVQELHCVSVLAFHSNLGTYAITLAIEVVKTKQ